MAGSAADGSAGPVAMTDKRPGLPRRLSGPWSTGPVWVWLVRVGGLGLLLADVAVSQRAPGLSGSRLVLTLGLVAASAAWLVPSPVDILGRRSALVLLAAGIIGGGLVVATSPSHPAVALPAVIALLAGSALSLPEATAIAACGLVTVVSAYLAGSIHGDWLFGACLTLAGGLLGGLWRRQFLVRAEQAELTAAQTQLAEQEHIRAQVLEERARIAREIHDVLAHTLGGLVMQLDAADVLLGEGADPSRGRDLVQASRRLAVEGLEESRRAVAALRADPVVLPEALAALAAGDGTGGGAAQVTQHVRGAPRQLPPQAGLALYRTAQEALANARKHAPGTPVTITLSFEEEATMLSVVNPTPPGERPDERPNPGLAATGGGYGLNGLAERAELIGGTLRAGPDEHGRWCVELRVPA